MIGNQDVVVIGGGPVGAACAREVARAGRSVLVLEPDDRPGAAWRASAGLLAPQIEAEPDAPLFELGIAGREYYRDRAADLAEETGIDVQLFDGGILRLAPDERDAERLRDSVAGQRQHGHAVDWLPAAEVRDERPWIGDCEGALWAPHDGSIDPVKLVAALRASAARARTRFVTDTALRLETSGGRVVGVRGGKDRYPAGDVVIAAGAWSGRIEGLPRPMSVEPVKGQMVARPWPRTVPPGIVFSRKSYVLERNGEAWCGATMEHSGFDHQVTDAGAEAVERDANRLIPLLAGVPVLRSWAGLRPGTPDGLPIIGREPMAPGLWYATGHGRSGILLAGITGVILTHLMAAEATFEGVDALAPTRFWSW